MKQRIELKPKKVLGKGKIELKPSLMIKVKHKMNLFALTTIIWLLLTNKAQGTPQVRNFCLDGTTTSEDPREGSYLASFPSGPNGIETYKISSENRILISK